MDRRCHRHRTYSDQAFRQRSAAGYFRHQNAIELLEQRTGRRADQSPQDTEASHVWSSRTRTDESQNVATESVAYFTTWCPAGTDIPTLVCVERYRWAIEDSFETAKNERFCCNG